MKKNICGAERVPAGTSMRAGQCGGRSRSHAGASHLSVRYYQQGIADKDMNYILHTGVIMLGIAILGMVCNITTGFLPPKSRWV